MKSHHVNTLLLFFIFIASCKGQDKTVLKNRGLPDSSGVTKAVFDWQPASIFPDKDPYFVETTAITSTQGPQSITRNMVQDKNGNLWLASWEGIICYDGKTFTNYTNKEGLRRYHTFAAMEDRAGNLWFGSIGGGVYRYDGKTFTNFTTHDGLANDNIGCFFQDNKGDIWIGTFAGASRYDGRTFTNFNTPEGMDINAIVQDKSGKMWFGTRGYTYYFDGKSMVNFMNEEGKPFQNVRSIIVDKSGNLWFGGQDGLRRYDGKTFTNFSKDFVGFLYEDKKGTIWMCASPHARDMALSRYDGNLLPVGLPDFVQVKKEKGQIFGILEDRDGHIWYGTERGAVRY